MAPTFSCSVAPEGKGSGLITITKTGGGPTDEKTDVVATVIVGKDKKDGAVCGSQLVKDHSEAKVSISAAIEASKKYKCTATQISATLACNPVR
jgi:hypothetical protein